MRVMVANNSSAIVMELAAKFPERIGWLQGPSSWKNPRPGLAYALDNDAFGAWKNHLPWDESAWIKMLDKASRSQQQPLWSLVPDVVADRTATLRSWDKHSPTVESFGFQKALAVQDGMTPLDVPINADLIFVGGTTQWKWRSLPMWAKHFPAVHVGRVRQTKLMRCLQLGVQSCDGTGWIREGQTGAPARFLRAYVEGFMQPHPELFSSPHFKKD